MTVYIVIFIIFAFIYLLPPNKYINIYFTSLVVILMSLLSAFRGNLGADTLVYLSIYNNVPDIFSINLEHFREENGFILFASICRTLNLSSETFFFFFSLIMNIVLSCALYRFQPKLIIPALILYYCTSFLHFEFNIIRHGMMTACIWMGFSYIYEKKIIKYLIWILIGCSFHKIGFLFLPFYWILNVEFNYKYIIFLFSIIALFLFVFNIFELLLNILPLNTVIGKSIDYYATDYAGGIGNSKIGVSSGLILNILISLYTFYKKKLFIHQCNISRNALFFGIFFYIIFSSIGVFSQRVASTLYISLCLIIPMIIYKLSAKPETKLVFKLLFICYCYSYLISNLNVKDVYGHYEFIPFTF